MLPASDPNKRIGALLFNTGGPGGVATPELSEGPVIVPFSENLKQHFDIVGMDPRGLQASQNVVCDPDLWNEANNVSAFPRNAAELDFLVNAWGAVGNSCRKLTGPLLDHTDSASVARDFEAVRLALGNKPLNFLGLSYGTVIGTAYLELFPENVRAMVLDSDVDHSQEQTFSILTESRGYEATLNKFFEWCESNST
jgi:pimeloyl-ACP methyl ester carboxylesterase